MQPVLQSRLSSYVIIKPGGRVLKVCTRSLGQGSVMYCAK
jgi:hypothetical protein